jgi:hypothetical protein
MIELALALLGGWVLVILVGGWWEGRHPQGPQYAEDSPEIDGIVFQDEPRHWS